MSAESTATETVATATETVATAVAAVAELRSALRGAPEEWARWARNSPSPEWVGSVEQAAQEGPEAPPEAVAAALEAASAAIAAAGVLLTPQWWGGLHEPEPEAEPEAEAEAEWTQIEGSVWGVRDGVTWDEVSRTGEVRVGFRSHWGEVGYKYPDRDDD